MNHFRSVFLGIKSNDNFRDIAFEDLPHLAAMDRALSGFSPIQQGGTFAINFWGNR